MTGLTIALLGDFVARIGPGPPLRLRTRRAQALLAYLALPAGQAHSRDKLAALLWGDKPPAHGRARLRETIFALRKTLAQGGQDWLQTDGDGLALCSQDVRVDVAEFERLVRDGTPTDLEAAAARYRGDLLHGLTGQAPDFEDWLMSERERLRELALDTLAKLLAHRSKAGATEGAIQTAVRLLALDPLQEAVHRELMRLYTRQDRRNAALKQYQSCITVLQRELGAEPEAETRHLYQDLVRRPSAETRTDAHDGPLARRRAEPAQLALSNTDTPLFGRDADQSRLRQAVDQASRGCGQLVVLVGEAGIGKSALIGAVAADALSAGARVLLGRCYESTQILAFGPWVEAIRDGGVLADEGAVEALDPVSRADLSRLFRELDRAGLPSPGDSDLRLFECMAGLAEQLAARRLIVLIIEDLHWADEMSLRLLAFLARRMSSWRLLLVATCREDELGDAVTARRTLDELGDQPLVTRVTLAPLSRADTNALTRSLAPVGENVEGLAALEDRVWVLSEGNPFVVVETVRGWRNGTPPSAQTTLPLPERVRAMITARLERLTEPARQLAATAAVIGREFGFPLLHHASGLDEASAADGVEELVRRRVLQGAGEQFDFVHHRLQTVVYGRILPHRRKLLHRSVGEALEGLSREALERDSLALGLHFRKAEVWEKAVAHMWRAGSQATERSAYRQAAACFEEALAALQHLPGNPDRLAQAVDLHLSARGALAPLREMDAILVHLRAAEATAVRLGDQRRLVAALTSLTNYFLEVGEVVEGLEAGRRAVALADAVDDFGLRVVANLNLGMVNINRGAYRAAKAIVSRLNVATLEGDVMRERFGMASYFAVSFRHMLGYCQAELGEVIEGVARGQDAVRLAAEIDHPYTWAAAHVWLGRIYFVQGEFAQASREWKAGFDIVEARQLGMPVGAGLGYAQVMSGNIRNGLSLLETDVARLMDTKWFGRKGVVSAWLAEAYMVAGRLVEAADAAQRALALTRQQHQRGYEAMALRLLGEITMHRTTSDSAGAEDFYRQALALAEELGMRPLAARCHLGLGRLHLHVDKRPAAHQHLATAQAMLAEMGMRLWRGQAEEALQALTTEARGHA